MLLFLTVGFVAVCWSVHYKGHLSLLPQIVSQVEPYCFSVTAKIMPVSFTFMLELMILSLLKDYVKLTHLISLIILCIISACLLGTIYQNAVAFSASETSFLFNNIMA